MSLPTRTFDAEKISQLNPMLARSSIAVFAAEDRIAADEHAAANGDAVIVRALGVQAAQVVHDHVVADVNLVGMAQRDVHAEHHVTAHRPEDPRVDRRAQHQAKRAGHPAGQDHRCFVGEQRHEAGPADKQLAVLVAFRAALVEHLLLDDGDLRVVVARRTVAHSRTSRIT
jgi:hypothetical protein